MQLQEIVARGPANAPGLWTNQRAKGPATPQLPLIRLKL